MLTLILIALAGLAAQLVDGGLGMGFGVTSTTILIVLAGLGPAQASAVVHAAEMGTTLASGLSHWRFGNVDWRMVVRLALPGAVGAFAGATVLSRISTEAARPVTAAVLAAVGANLVWRFSRGRARRSGSHSTAFLGGLGLFGGFVDATGGGGWGPVTTSTLLSFGRSEPRRIVGTVNTAEFLVTTAAVAGFTVGLWDELVAHAAAVIALLAGGCVAAPLAAWLVSRMNPALLGGVVGTLLVLLNLPQVLTTLGVAGPVVWCVRAAVVVLGGAFAVRGRRRRRAAPEPRRTGSTAEPTGRPAGVS